MPLRRVPSEELPQGFAQRVDLSLRHAGDARFLEVVANAPHMATWYFDSFYREIFFGGIVPLRVKELVRLRLSQLHGCAY